jgi:hypothetical protein
MQAETIEVKKKATSLFPSMTESVSRAERPPTASRSCRIQHTTYWSINRVTSEDERCHQDRRAFICRLGHV